MYVLIDNNNTVLKYPYSLSQLKKDNPDVSFPSEPTELTLSSFNVYPVTKVDKPVASDPILKNVIEVTPTLVSDVWVQTWQEVDATAEQIDTRQKSQTYLTQQATIKADNFVQTFINMTPTQVESYINNNTANLAAARALLVKMGIMLLLAARREFE